MTLQRLAKWFLQHDPDYRAAFLSGLALERVAWTLGIDKGIDLIAETYDGGGRRYPGQALRRAALDLEAGHRHVSQRVRPRREIAERLLIGTTPIGSRSTSAEAMGGPGAAGAPRRRSCTCSPRTLVRWPSSAHDLRSGAPQAAKAPLPHQQDALRAIAEGLSSNHRGKVIMACGTGKTLIALWAAEQAGTELTLGHV